MLIPVKVGFIPINPPLKVSPGVASAILVCPVKTLGMSSPGTQLSAPARKAVGRFWAQQGGDFCSDFVATL